MSISEELSTLLSDLATQIDQNITLFHYFNLAISQQKESQFLSEYFCSDKGDFLINEFKCLCDLGMFGYHCQEKGIEHWQGTFRFFKYMFGIIYGILISIFWISLLKKIAKDFNEKELLKRMLCTPKYLIFFNLVIFSTSRFFYIAIDPFCQHGLIKHQHDSMVFYMSLSALIGFYIQILVVWLGILAVFDLGLGRINNHCFTCMYNRVKIIGEIIMIMLYPSQILANYFASIRRTTNKIRNTIIIFGAVFGCALIIFTLILIKDLKNKFDILYGKHKQEKEEIQTKVKARVYHGNTRDLVGNEIKDEAKIQNKKDVIEFLIEANHNGLMSVIESTVLGREVINVETNTIEDKNESCKIRKKSFSKDCTFKNEMIASQDDEIRHFTKVFKSQNENAKIHYENSSILDNESDNEFLHEHLNKKTSRKTSNLDSFHPELNKFVNLKKMSTCKKGVSSINKFSTYRGRDINSTKANKKFHMNTIINKEELFENKLDYETELHYLDIYKERDSSINFYLNHDKLENVENNHLKCFLSSQKTQLQTQTNKVITSISSNDSQIFQLSQNPLTHKDKKIIYNIFTISITFLILSFIIFYCCVFLNINPIIHSQSSQIVVLFILFSTEITNLILVYNLFFRDRQDQEYQSLKVISEIDKYLSFNGKENEPCIVFDVFTTNKLYYRFKNFIKNYQ